MVTFQSYRCVFFNFPSYFLVVSFRWYSWCFIFLVIDAIIYLLSCLYLISCVTLLISEVVVLASIAFSGCIILISFSIFLVMKEGPTDVKC
jgi:hypothetical protein